MQPEIFVSMVLAVATVVLVGVTAYYAWQTKHLVDEMRKDRRRQFLENALRKAHTPLYEVFRRALIESTRPRTATSSYSFTIDEIDQIRAIVEKYGHYLDYPLLTEIVVTIVNKTGKTEWQPAEMGNLYEKLMGKFESLRKELQTLVSLQSPKSQNGKNKFANAYQESHHKTED